MKTYTYTFEYPDSKLSEHIPVTTFMNHDNILVQIFSGHGEHALQYYARQIKRTLPHAVCIGTTTDGEIAHENISTEHIVIAVSLFENTTIKSAWADSIDDYQNGREIASSLITDNTRLLILFSDGTTCNGELLLRGIESIDPTVPIAGGMAGDNGQFLQTYVLEDSRIVPQGVVGVSLNSDTLQVQNHFNFNWSPVGIEHTINEVDENRVYRIDDLTAVDFYAKYLGEEVSDALPATGIEFPLLIERRDIKIARAVIAKHEDNSLSFAGNLEKGDKVRLGFGNAELIINESLRSFKQRYHEGVETFFIYSCMARRRYMPGFVEMEIKPFAKTATTCGFFTYGEFFHNKKHNQLLNQTLTVAALREAPPAPAADTRNDTFTHLHDDSDYATTIKALTHLIERSTQDYEEQAQTLEAEKRYSQQLLESQKIFLRHAIHEINTPLSVIMNNIELFELEYGSHTYLSNIEAAMKNIYGIYDDLGYLVNKDRVSYPRKKIALIDFIRSRIAFFSVVAQQANLSFEFHQTCEEPELFMNETKLQRIIDNNITNAIKYTKTDEKIIISLENTPDDCILTFKSSSLLIRDIEKIFNAYYRENMTKDGLGLGLNLVRQICDEESIRIEVDSTEKCTSFRYYFPKGDKHENTTP